MSTAYILNCFGDYDTEPLSNKKGTAFTFSGVPFFFPYREVSVIPNYTFRVVDHAKSTPEGDVPGELTYQSVNVGGDKIADALLNQGRPHSGKDMGILIIEGKATGKAKMNVYAGQTDDGEMLFTDVIEKEPTKGEWAEAEAAGKQYKETIIADYFQAKRERMTGGRGALHPSGMVRTYMEELHVEDIDDVTAHAKQLGGFNPEMLAQIISTVMRETSKDNADAIQAAVEKSRNSNVAKIAAKQTGGHKVHLDLESRKREWEKNNPNKVMPTSFAVDRKDEDVTEEQPAE